MVVVSLVMVVVKSVTVNSAEQRVVVEMVMMTEAARVEVEKGLRRRLLP